METEYKEITKEQIIEVLDISIEFTNLNDNVLPRNEEHPIENALDNTKKRIVLQKFREEFIKNLNNLTE